MYKYLVFFLAGFLLLTGMQAGEQERWFRAGSNRLGYYMGLDTAMQKNGAMPSVIRSLHDDVSGFATLMRNEDPAAYRGKNIRLSGYMKSENVSGFAGFWLRLDGKGSEQLGFDNMSQRPVRNTTGWKKYTIEMEVPEETLNMAYGALLEGPGRIWFAAVTIEITNP